MTAPWIKTYTGKKFYPGAPNAEDIDIVDIAHALSNVCRYSGHTQHFYSVAQHSVLVSVACEPVHWLWGLLHDATEAYLADIARPTKTLLPEYVALEGKIMQVIAAKFGLAWPEPPAVKLIDTRILLDEADVLMGGHKDWGIDAEPLGVDIQPWSPGYARTRFLERYEWVLGL